MRLLIAITLAAALAACNTTTDEEPSETISAQPAEETPAVAPAQPEPAPEVLAEPVKPLPSYNEELWYISGGWPGEYPSGFSVLGKSVVLMGRAHMHEDAAQTIACPVPQNATYQQWNTSRVDLDELDFVTVSEKVEVTILKSAEVDAPIDADFENKLSLEIGDKLIFLRYLGEGWSIWEHDFQEYDIEENALRDISDSDTAFRNSEDDRLWVQLSCADEDRTRAWLLFDDVVKTEGMAMTPIIGYGDSRDLTAQDRVDAVMQTNFYLEEQARAEAEAAD